MSVFKLLVGCVVAGSLIFSGTVAASSGAPIYSVNTSFPASEEIDPGAFGLEVIEDVLPVFVGHDTGATNRWLRDPIASDEFPPLRVLVSKERYWVEDLHMDVVVRLALKDITDVGLRMSWVDETGEVLARWQIAQVPGRQFVWYPRLPDSYEGEGRLVFELTGAEGEIEKPEEPVRVERYLNGEAGSGRVALRIANPERLEQRGIPVTTGVPFPRGVLSNASGIRLVNENGEVLPMQVRETARWSRYGYIKWVLCDFVVDLAGDEKLLYVEYGPDVKQTPEAALKVDAGGGEMPVLDTGLWVLDDGLWLRNADGNLQLLLDSSALSGGYVEHLDGRIYRMSPDDDYAIEESGSEKVVVRRKGWYTTSAGERFCQYIVRYHFYRNSPLVRIFHSWIFTGDGNRDGIADIGWRFGYGTTPSEAAFLTDFGGDGKWVTGDYLLQYDYEHFSVVAGDREDTYAGGRAPGVSKVRLGDVDVYFGSKDFWQNYPSELEFTNDAFYFHSWPRHGRAAGWTLDKKLILESGEPALPSAARYALEADDYLTLSEWTLNVLQARFMHEGEFLDFRIPDAIAADPIFSMANDTRVEGQRMSMGRDEPETINAQGISRTEELWLYVDADGQGDGNAARLMESLNAATLRAVVDPWWIARSEVVPYLYPHDPDQFPDEEEVYELAALSPGRLGEHLGIYGMWIYGDYPLWRPNPLTREPSLYRAYRQHHLGWPYPYIPYIRSGDSRYYKLAEAATRQMIDVSTQHYVSADVERATGPEFRRGYGSLSGWMPWFPGSSQTPLLRNLHTRVDYLLHAWYLTGYERAWDEFGNWCREVKIEDNPGAGPIKVDGNRNGQAPMWSFLHAYEATFDPWFLVAMHGIAEGHELRYREGYEGRLWMPADRDFQIFTGKREFGELYVDNYARSAADIRVATYWNWRVPNLPPKAHAWRLTGDEYFLRRVVHGVNHAKAYLQRHGPEYLLGYPTGRGYNTGYTLFIPNFLYWFPSSLAVLAEVDPKPQPVVTTFSIRPEVEKNDQGDNVRPLTVYLKKDDGQPLKLFFLGRIQGASILDYDISGPGETPANLSWQYYRNVNSGWDPVSVSDEGDAAGKWATQWIKAITIPADEPAGQYRVRFENLPGWINFPLSDVDTPEVILFKNGNFAYQSGFSDFSFLVPEGTKSFSIELPNFSRVAIWYPNGRNAWWQTDHIDDPENYRRADIDVPQGMDGRIWRITGAQQGFTLDPRLPSIIAADPARWFNP